LPRSAPSSARVTGADVQLPGQEAQQVVRFALEPEAGAPVEAELLATEIETTEEAALGSGQGPGSTPVRLRSQAATTSPTRSPPSAPGARRGGSRACARTLGDFPGVARRLGRRAAGGARIYDDYAHHPTEVAATSRPLASSVRTR
jgi:UDP-N-acetylmuramate--alanine ligase